MSDEIEGRVSSGSVVSVPGVGSGVVCDRTETCEVSTMLDEPFSLIKSMFL